MNKKGISLMVLVITIIVILILAGAMIITLYKNNPITVASKAVFLNDLRSFQAELELYKVDKFANKLGQYDPTKLQSDETSITYDGAVDTSKTIKDIIPSLGGKDNYSGEYVIIDGELVYQGIDNNKKDWANEGGTDVITVGEPTIVISNPSKVVVKSGNDITYGITFSSTVAVKTINLLGKVVLADDNGVDLPTQPVINIGTISGTSSSYTRQVEITIKTDTLADGEYKLKIKPESVTNINNISNTQDKLSIVGFTIDSTAPINPIMSANPSLWTNTDVTVTIDYSEDTVNKEYSFDTITWNTYVDPIVVSTNNTTVYARGKDKIENISGVSTITVANIDKTLPTVTATNGGSSSSSVTINATASDLNSGIKEYYYSKDNGATWTTATSEASYIFSELTTGTYNCKVKVVDNAGNEIISSVVAIATQGLGTISMSASPTSWTNGNVTVTCNYPTEIITKQYSTDGTTWQTYTSPVVVSTNNTTVYSKGYDAGNNQTTQATITVANIDKIVPIITVSNGGSTSSSVTVTVSASDTGGSGLNTGSYQYSKDNGATWTTPTSATSYTFTGLTTATYNCKVKVVDNAGNETISNVVAIATQGLGTISMSASPTNWTNGNVTVTCNYPASVITKQYSTNGTTWNIYTSPVVVSTNNTTVYARGYDAGGNQTLQATMTVANIDKTSPTVPTVNLNGYASGTWTNGNVTQTFSSADYQSGIQKYQYTVDGGANWYDCPNPWTISWDGGWNFYIRAIDNAGNISAASSVYTIYRDATVPTYSSYTIANVSTSGYDVYVYGVNDNFSGINRVQFPTTSPSSGWIWLNGTNLGNGTWYCRVNASDYGNVMGYYQTHIYIYDNAGNQTAFATSGANVTTPYPIASAPGTEASPGTPKSVNTTIDGLNPTYSDPVIPAGFVAVNTTDASWNNVSTDWNKGLVIQDSYGNQFVWVPVDGSSVAYSKWTTIGISYEIITDDTTPSGFNTTSITTTYKGFYIARYESAFDYNGGSIRAASKKSTNKTYADWSTTRNVTYSGYLWNFISYTDSKTYAENMDTSYGYNTSLVGTNLITGAQWDTALKWIQNSGKSVTDSRTWGNHGDSTSPANVFGCASLQISGYSDYWKAKNIYDLAGNTWEWTNEMYSSGRVCRGGDYFFSGSTSPAASRGGSYDTFVDVDIGFRVALYVL